MKKVYDIISDADSTLSKTEEEALNAIQDFSRVKDLQVLKSMGREVTRLLELQRKSESPDTLLEKINSYLPTQEARAMYQLYLKFQGEKGIQINGTAKALKSIIKENNSERKKLSLLGELQGMYVNYLTQLTIEESGWFGLGEDFKGPIEKAKEESSQYLYSLQSQPIIQLERIDYKKLFPDYVFAGNLLDDSGKPYTLNPFKSRAIKKSIKLYEVLLANIRYIEKADNLDYVREEFVRNLRLLDKNDVVEGQLLNPTTSYESSDAIKDRIVENVMKRIDDEKQRRKKINKEYQNANKDVDSFKKTIKIEDFFKKDTVLESIVLSVKTQNRKLIYDHLYKAFFPDLHISTIGNLADDVLKKKDELSRTRKKTRALQKENAQKHYRSLKSKYEGKNSDINSSMYREYVLLSGFAENNFDEKNKVGDITFGEWLDNQTDRVQEAQIILGFKNQVVASYLKSDSTLVESFSSGDLGDTYASIVGAGDYFSDENVEMLSSVIFQVGLTIATMGVGMGVAAAVGIGGRAIGGSLTNFISSRSTVFSRIATGQGAAFTGKIIGTGAENIAFGVSQTYLSQVISQGKFVGDINSIVDILSMAFVRFGVQKAFALKQAGKTGYGGAIMVEELFGTGGDAAVRLIAAMSFDSAHAYTVQDFAIALAMVAALEGVSSGIRKLNISKNSKGEVVVNGKSESEVKKRVEKNKQRTKMVKTPEHIKKILENMGLSKAKRLLRSKELLGKKFTDKQKEETWEKQLKEAHLEGGYRFGQLYLKELHKTITVAEKRELDIIRVKKRKMLMRESTFSKDEANMLMDNGLVGIFRFLKKKQVGPDASVKPAKKAEPKVANKEPKQKDFKPIQSWKLENIVPQKIGDTVEITDGQNIYKVTREGQDGNTYFTIEGKEGKFDAKFADGEIIFFKRATVTDASGWGLNIRKKVNRSDEKIIIKQADLKIHVPQKKVEMVEVEGLGKVTVKDKEKIDEFVERNADVTQVDVATQGLSISKRIGGKNENQAQKVGTSKSRPIVNKKKIEVEEKVDKNQEAIDTLEGMRQGIFTYKNKTNNGSSTAYLHDFEILDDGRIIALILTNNNKGSIFSFVPGEPHLEFTLRDGGKSRGAMVFSDISELKERIIPASALKYKSGKLKEIMNDGVSYRSTQDAYHSIEYKNELTSVEGKIQLNASSPEELQRSIQNLEDNHIDTEAILNLKQSGRNGNYTWKVGGDGISMREWLDTGYFKIREKRTDFSKMEGFENINSKDVWKIFSEKYPALDNKDSTGRDKAIREIFMQYRSYEPSQEIIDQINHIHAVSSGNKGDLKVSEVKERAKGLDMLTPGERRFVMETGMVGSPGLGRVMGGGIYKKVDSGSPYYEVTQGKGKNEKTQVTDRVFQGFNAPRTVTRVNYHGPITFTLGGDVTITIRKDSGGNFVLDCPGLRITDYPVTGLFHIGSNTDDSTLQIKHHEVGAKHLSIRVDNDSGVVSFQDQGSNYGTRVSGNFKGRDLKEKRGDHDVSGKKTDIISLGWPNGLSTKTSQGVVDDCNFLFGLNATKNHPDRKRILTSMLSINRDGNYEVKFEGYHKPIVVKQSDFADMGGAKVGTSNIGDLVLQRAYARAMNKRRGGESGDTYKQQDGRYTHDFGSNREVLELFFGKKIRVEGMYVSGGILLKEDFDGNFHSLGGSYLPYEEFLLKNLRIGNFMGLDSKERLGKASTYQAKDFYGNNISIAYSHAYTIYNFNVDKGWINVVDSQDSSIQIKFSIRDVPRIFPGVTVGQL